MPEHYWRVVGLIGQSLRRTDRSGTIRVLVEDAAVARKIGRLESGKLVLTKGAAK